MVVNGILFGVETPDHLRDGVQETRFAVYKVVLIGSSN